MAKAGSPVSAHRVEAWLTPRVSRRRGMFLWAFIAGLLTALGHAPFNLWPIAVLGYALVFTLFRLARSPRAAAFVGWGAGTGHFALALNWIVEPFFVDLAQDGWMAPFAIVFLSAGLALFWAGGLALARYAGGRPLAFIIGLALAELLRSYIFTGFPWGLIGHGLIPSPFLQFAALVGPHGLTMLMLLMAVTLWRLAGPRPWVSGILLPAFVALFFIGGQMGKPVLPAPDAPVIRMVQPNAPQHLKWQPEYVPMFFRRMMDATAAPATGQAPALIVWPETALPVLLENADEILRDIAAAAGDAPVVLGVQRFDGPRLYNSAVLLDQQGDVAALYDKHHLVPFGEYMPLGDLLADWGIHGLAATEGQGYSAGPGARLMDVPGIGPALPLICYEAIFPNDVAAAPARPRLLLQITNDAWFGQAAGPYQHLAQARLRAVEQGLPMVRVANTGVSAMIGPKGDVQGELALGETGWLDAPLPPALPATPYARAGDLPFLILFTVLMAAVVARRWAIGR